MKPSNKDLNWGAIILVPTFIFLIVWEGFCAYILLVDPMQSMDNSLIAIMMIAGLFTIKRIFDCLKSIRAMRVNNKT